MDMSEEELIVEINRSNSPVIFEIYEDKEKNLYLIEDVLRLNLSLELASLKRVEEEFKKSFSDFKERFDYDEVIAVKEGEFQIRSDFSLSPY